MREKGESEGIREKNGGMGSGGEGGKRRGCVGAPGEQVKNKGERQEMGGKRGEMGEMGKREENLSLSSAAGFEV